MNSGKMALKDLFAGQEYRTQTQRTDLRTQSVPTVCPTLLPWGRRGWDEPRE